MSNLDGTMYIPRGSIYHTIGHQCIDRVVASSYSINSIVVS